MKWNIEYSKRARDFIEEHGVRDKVRDSVNGFILRITGSNINIDVKKRRVDSDHRFMVYHGRCGGTAHPSSYCCILNFAKGTG